MDRPPTPGLDRAPSGYGRTEHGLRCPRCQSALIRVRRQPFDRLISLLSPRRRYRCVAIGCGWEGTVSAKR
jgi:hypothetical protein